MKIFEFKNTGKVFSAHIAAENWCKENGYSYGCMCGNSPIGIVKGDVDIAKWRNLCEADIDSLDGTMYSNDWRMGDVVITLVKGV